ncbi:MAG TPA: 30S ribosome-binding factor RbfA [bacterium]|nr:30S ribosome-binding factor RbfA [bacterium]
MKNFRCQRVADLITREVSRIIQTKISDPRLQAVTITGTRVTRDIRIAHVFYTVMNRESEDEAVTQSLAKASGFIRHELGLVLSLRHVPELRFEYDVSLEHGNRIWEQLEQLREEDDDGTGA